MKYLVTGSVGFIGFHLVSRLLDLGHDVAGIDNWPLSDMRDTLVRERYQGLLTRASQCRGTYTHHEVDMAVMEDLLYVYRVFKPDVVVHLAGLAGIRKALDQARPYLLSNIQATFNLLECTKMKGLAPQRLLVASSSSVYGAGYDGEVFDEIASHTDKPLSFYAATKKSIEVICHAHSVIYGLPIVGMRFFTVYGPFGRPDMAIWRFVQEVEDGETVLIYGDGSATRDFTYVDDVIEAIMKIDEAVVPGMGFIPMNVGGGHPISIKELLFIVGEALGVTPKVRYIDPVPGDAPSTRAATGRLISATGFAPAIRIVDGINKFVVWFRAWRVT